MNVASEETWSDFSGTSAVPADGSKPSRALAASSQCFHCGTPCGSGTQHREGKSFCCAGCALVFDILSENGLDQYYALNAAAGARIRGSLASNRFGYLDEPEVRRRLVDFQDVAAARVTFRLPAIHCVACVWLLENLFQLNPAIGSSTVNFPRKEVSIAFDPSQLPLSALVELLARIGYEPELQLSDVETPRTTPRSRRLWLQIGVAGFAFGNIMLFSIASYFGLDAFDGPAFQALFNWLSLALALPVVAYSASGYWCSAWTSLREHTLTIEVPIALGIAALFLQSTWQVLSGSGEGYFDSLAGLVFFLLCGRLFQEKTYDRLQFDRDYRDFFPLAVTRLRDGQEESISVGRVEIGDRLRIRHGELIPADARLLEGEALVDYSFVTGEAEPRPCQIGAPLHAGGRQTAGAITVETVKAVSQSYLTSLWNQEAFHPGHKRSLQSVMDRFGKHFTRTVIAVAMLTGAFWWNQGSGTAILTATAVLIVACPCALALAAPFTLGTAIRLLGRRHVFLRGPQVVEQLAATDTFVFDKTGTLTESPARDARFEGSTPLTIEESSLASSLASMSVHPKAAILARMHPHDTSRRTVKEFREHTGRGIEGRIDHHHVELGSAAWLASRGYDTTAAEPGTVHLAIDGQHRGSFHLDNPLRCRLDDMFAKLGRNRRIVLLSGDSAREAGRFRTLLGPRAELHFEQSPLNKLQFVRRLQDTGHNVMMVGDGLNDAGALKQADTGIAVIEKSGAFSPASDIILDARRIQDLPEILGFSRRTVRVIKTCLAVSCAYNIAGVSIAAQGLLSPVVCAILMPLSSVTVVLLAVGLTTLAGHNLKPGTEVSA